MRLTKKLVLLLHDTWNQSNTILLSMFFSKVQENCSWMGNLAVDRIWLGFSWMFMRLRARLWMRKAEVNPFSPSNMICWSWYVMDTGRLTQLIALAGPSGGWRKTIIDKSIASVPLAYSFSSRWITPRWSAKHGVCPAGDQDLHHYVGELLYKGKFLFNSFLEFLLFLKKNFI